MTDIDLVKKHHSTGSGMHDMTIKRKLIHWIRHNLSFFVFGVFCKKETRDFYNNFKKSS